MATTPNYGWTTPDDTNLVKNGAADIRTLANAIDSTVKTNADAAVLKTLVDAKGDLLAGTAADTIARLAVGANGTVLTADSAEATGLKWGSVSAAKTFSLLNSGGTALTGAADVTVSGITNQDELFIIFDAAGASSSNASYSIRINSSSASNYIYSQARQSLSSTYSTSINSGVYNGALDRWIFGSQGGSTSSDLYGWIRIQGARTSGVKIIDAVTGTNGGFTDANLHFTGGLWNDNASITSITFRTSAGTWNAGTVYIYGAA